MLENEPENTTEAGTASVNDAATRPVRTRRRAASRAAGPPKAVEPIAPVVTAAAPDETTDEVEEENVDETPEAPAPDEAPAQDEAPAEVEAPAQVETPAPAEAPEQSGPMLQPEDLELGEPVVQARPRRRRVTRSAAAPKSLPAPDQPVLTEPAGTAGESADSNDRADSNDKVESNDKAGANQDTASQRNGRGDEKKVEKALADPFQPPQLPDPAELLAERDAARAAENEGGADSDKADSDGAGDEGTAGQTSRSQSSKADQRHDSGRSSDSDDSDDDSSDNDNSQDDGSEDDDSGNGSGNRRRRRRRGGRRRRRSSSRDDSDDSQDNDGGGDHAGNGQSRSDSQDDKPEGSSDDSGSDRGKSNGDKTDGQRSGNGSGDDQDSSDDSDDQPNGRRRRRRRRRSGGGGSSDSEKSDEVTGIEGSTRMEAKRQRRREGRASRHRTPILSEAEFLARRESVDRQMIIRQNEELSQIAVLEDNVLVEHYVDRASATSLIGNVYLGRVQNVLPSMEAAFIDIGRGRNAVLYAGDVNWDAHGVDSNHRQVENALKSGQTVLVQVTKDPVGAKGARLTNHISLPGRYIVYAPHGHLSGISRKLPDNERKRLRDILGELVEDEASVIVRTAAEGASEEELVRDVNRLKAQWEAIEKQVSKGGAPVQLYAEPDPTVRIVRDLFTEDFSKLVIQGNGTGNDAYDTVTAYVSHVAPHLAERIEKWEGEDSFSGHRIDEQISKALERKVFLPSGGSLVIDRTEAMTVIDVNTGKFTGSAGNLEATVTSNNLEAAEEVVRQLRLRDIGGIVVVDFIDMVLPANRELLLRRLVECLGRDRTRHQVAEVTSLGLVQMTRKKIGTGLAEAFTEPCEHCAGRGYEVHDTPVDNQEAADGGDRRRGGRGGGNGRRRGGRNNGGGNNDSQGSNKN